MFKSYFILALRNLWKRKTSTIINVLGLSVGLSCCALVFLFVQHELSFDKGFYDAKDIYRVTSDFGKGSSAPTVTFPYAALLKNDIPEITQVSRLDASKCTCIVQVNGPGNKEPLAVDNGYWTDPTFFDIFSFHFLQGNRATAFTEPNTIVLSQPFAEKLFGANTSVIGKTVKTGGNTYTVSGVFKKDFLNHFNADFFASNNSNGIREDMAVNTSWVVNPNYYTYIKLKPSANEQHVIQELKAYTTRHAGPDIKTTGDHMDNSLQALKDIHLNSGQYYSYMEVKQGNIHYLYILGSIALAILLLGCINYMNLSTAQAIDRAREVGVRRVLGAAKSAIRYQFFIETIAVSLLGLVVAVGLAFAALPVFNYLTGQTLSFFAKENYTLILWMCLIALATGLLAGVYPALHLSAFRPVKVLKGKIADRQHTFSVRKVLVTLQFVVATCLVFATIVIWRQYGYMRNAKPGFDQDQELVVYEQSSSAQANTTTLIDELSANILFKTVAGGTAPLVSGDFNLYPQGKTVHEQQNIMLDFVDPNYIRTLGLKLIAGANFTPVTFSNTDMHQDMEDNDIARQIIINEQTAKVFGLDPYTAPGKYVSRLHKGIVYNFRIMGVMKDYNIFSMHSPIMPFGIILANPRRFTTIVAKIRGSNASAAISFVNKTWKRLNPDTPFNYGFMNKAFSYDYDEDQKQQTMLTACSFIAIFISSLGLLGLITYTLGQRSREIGIRKVIGASVSNIVLLFYRQYFWLVLIANALALPLTWYYMSKWLQDFAYRIDITLWMFVVSLSAGLVIAFATIAFKTIQAATVNPIQSLRSE
jgi:putative ABC transport system permease protein